MVYTTERVTIHNLTEEILQFFFDASKELHILYGNKFPGWKKYSIVRFVKEGYVTVCRRDGKIVGFMFARLLKSIFDPSVILLRQESLYALPKTRAANLLLKDFIDFGMANANHIITVIGKQTNIKPQSLRRLGFDELETTYRLETKRGQ